jgi:hypothetical protein
MTITTAQSINGAPWSSGTYAGDLTVNRQLGPQQTVAPMGATVIAAGLNLSLGNPTNTTGVPNITAGFDPSVVAALSVKLRTTGQIWPCGFG